jgi:hypothetical protein
VTAFRLIVLVAVWVLGTSTFSLAQEETPETPPPPVLPAEPVAPVDEPESLLVPDVRDLPLVFAKGVLEDAGFAWKVEGKVEGYAVNLVASQDVAPGTEVVDNGAPTLTLKLRKNPAYDELGLPMNEAPYPGTELVPVDSDAPDTSAGPEESEEQEDATDDGSDTGEAGGDGSADAASDGYAQGADTVDVELTGSDDAPSDEEATRPPAFVVPGAPAEPLDEIPLTERAENLLGWAQELDEITAEALDHYAYQHAWIVTGAGFGWWHGAEALRILIRVDETMQKRFDVGREHEAEARAALAEVERKSDQ